MKTYHLPSVQDWSATIERGFRRLSRRLFSSFQLWRTKLPNWKVKR